MKKLKFVTWMATFAAASILIVTSCSKPNPSLKSKPLQVESQPPILVEPNARVDKVRRGMNEQEVEVALGQPEKKDRDTSFYLSQGIYASFNKEGKEGVVYNVKCVKPFAGVTKEGIGIGSTRAELIKAYGTPDQDQHFDHGDENLWFAPLATSFYLENDKITSFIVHWR